MRSRAPRLLVLACAATSINLAASAPSLASMVHNEPDPTQIENYDGVHEPAPSAGEPQVDAEPNRTNEVESEANLPPLRPRVKVDSSELNTLSPETLETISVEAANILAENGFDAHQLQLSLVWIDRMAFTRGVRARFVDTDFVITAEDGDLRGPIVSQCTECGEPEYQTVSLEGVFEAIERYHKAQDDAAKVQKVAQPPKPSLPAPPPEPAPKRGLGPLGGAGIASLSLGGAIMVTGVVLVALPPMSETDLTGPGDETELFEVTSTANLRTPGYAVLGAGAAVAIAGAALLVVDKKRSRRRDAMAITPMVDPRGSFGLVARGRF